MKRSQVVHLTLLASLAASLTSCSHKPTRYCVDGENRVVDDVDCQQPRSSPFYNSYHWYYIRSRRSAAAGTILTGGSTVVPREGFSRPTTRGVMGSAGEDAAGHGGGEGAGE